MDPNNANNRKRNLLIIFGIVLTLILIGTVGFLLYRWVNTKKTATPVLPPGQNSSRLQSKAQTESFVCPTIASACKDAKNYQNSSFSAVLPPNTPLFAAYDGLIMGAKTMPAFKDDQSYSIIVLVDEQKTLQAEYAYMGNLPVTRKVKKGELIATASGKPIFSFANNSLNFQLIKAEGTANGKMNLQPDKFIN